MTKSYSKFYSILTTILIIFVFILAIVIVSSAKYPIGSDVYYHLQLGQLYMKGDLGGAWNLMFHSISFFYPPLFHVFIDGPISLSANPYFNLQILECLFLPLTFLASVWLIWKYTSAKAALFTGFALLASWSFIDGTLQARPESLDMLLFPIVIYAVMEAKKKTAGLAATIMVWSHGFASISSLLGVFIYKLRDKTWRKTLLLIVLAVTPIIVLSFIYFEGAIQFWLLGQTATTNPQNYAFWHIPFPWVIYYCGLSLWGIPFLLRRHKTQLETLLTYAFLGNTLMLIFWADRWLHYAALPWAMLYGIGIAKLHGWKLYLMIAVSIGYVVLYVSIYLITAQYHLYWQPGD